MSEKLPTGVVQPETFSITWKIERFFGDCKKDRDYYRSPVSMIPYAGKTTNWSLRVYPKGVTEKYKGYVSLFVMFSCQNDIEVTVDYQCSIVGVQNNLPAKEIKGCTCKYLESDWGWFEFAENNVTNSKNSVFIDDTLTILCEITFLPPTQDVIKKFSGYNKWLKKIENGLGDYEKLLESDNFTDVTFNVKGEQLNLHKAILSCRNPVFKAMFEHDMKENRQNSVDITDIDYDVIKELFRFLYSGKVKNIEKIASDLLIAADKYQVTELKALCEKTLYDKLTVDNAIDYLKLTEMCDTIQLKNLVIQFVATHSKDIIEKPRFSDLNGKVIYQVLLAVAK